jgi:hypothetical protein
MRIIYGLMGLVARMSNRMSRFRVNGIPSNWGIIGICAFIILVASEARQDAVSNGAIPRAMTAGEFLQLAESDFGHRYVAVRGELHPEASLRIESSGDDYDLVPMVDKTGGRGFFVKTGVSAYSGRQPFEATVTGMMWGVDSSLRRDLAAKVGTGNFNTDAQLSEGQTPGNPVTSTVLIIILSAISGVLLLSSLLKHVIFQRTGAKATASIKASATPSPFASAATAPASTPATSAPGAVSEANARQSATQNATLRVTGKLRLHQKCAARFLDVPAFLMRLKGGELAVASHIDASPSLDGRVTESRVGVWLIVPQAGSLRWEEGRLYHGFKPAPALRLRYNDALDKGKKSTAVLSFANETERAAIMLELTKEAAGSGTIQ